jgi:plasmid stabilization system protein ParE
MSYQVSLLWRAERDLDKIVAWIGTRSTQGAAAWLRRWDRVVEELRKGADKCRLAPESADHDIEIRQVIFKTRQGLPYRALFTIRDKQVYVMHVRGPGQDLLAPDEMAFPERD